MRKYYPRRAQSIMRGESPVVKVGGFYEKTEVKRDIGDQWTEADGRTWEKTSYGKMIVRKIDPAIPQFCPKCDRIMNKQVDNKMFMKTGKCLDCNVEDQHEMIKAGTFKEFKKRTIANNMREFLKESKVAINEYLESFGKETFVSIDENENPVVEKWSGGDKEKLKEFFEKELEFIEAELEKLDKEYPPIEEKDNGRRIDI